jgi:hypothetical protein
MPRDITVTFDDGSQHIYQGAPDDLTPEQVTARAQQEFGKQVTHLDGGRKPGMVDQFISGLKEHLGNLARGVGQGAAAALNTIETMGTVPHKVDDQGRMYWDAPGGGKVYASPDEQAALSRPTLGARLSQDVEKALPTPNDTGIARYVRKAEEAATGGLLYKGGASPTGIAAGAAGGAGGEAAANALGDNPVARFIGGLVASGGAALGLGKMSGPRTQTVNVANEALEGIKPEDLQRAQAFQAAALQKGVRLDLAQALEGIGVSAGNLTTLRNVLANRKEGDQVQTLLRQQPTASKLMAEQSVFELPGSNYGLPQSANNLQEAATKRLAQVRAERGAVTDPLFEKAGTLPPEVQSAAVAEIDNFLKQPSLSDAARTAATNLRSRLMNSASSESDVSAAQEALANATKASEKLAARAQLGQANAGMSAMQPIESGAATRAIKDTAGPFKPTAIYSPDPQEAGQIAALAARVKGVLKQHQPLADAENTFARLTEENVNPVKQAIGPFSGPRGYQSDRQAAVSKLTSLFDNGRDPTAKVSPIKILGEQINKVDPTAFQDGFKSWLSSKISKAVRPTEGLEMSPDDTAKSLYDSLAGDASRWQGIRDGVEVVARQSGQNPVDVMRGLEHMRMILKAASNRPDSVGGLSSTQLDQIAGKSLPADALRVFSFLPFEKAARGVESRAVTKTLRTFDDLLTSPDGAATLAQLGRVPVMSTKAQAILNGFVQGTIAADDGNQKLRNQPQTIPGVMPY